MKNVYRDPTLTIAVHSATSCKDGFLGAQNYGQLTWREFKFAFDRHRARWIVRKYPHVDCSYHSHLTTCGWSLQEAVLPRRILHFPKHRDGLGV